MLDFTDTELEQIKANIHKLPAGLKQQVTDQMAELAKRKTATTARDTLVAFGKQTYPNFMVGAHHRKITAIFEAIARGEKKRVIINIAPRHGKLIADDTPILTTKGWTTHGNLQIGDEVFSPSGKPIKVIGVSDKAEANVRVEFFDGSVIYCHEDHEWTLFNASRSLWETIEAKTFLQSRKGRWGQTTGVKKQVICKGIALHFLPKVQPLQYETSQQTIHPYVLGAWLGDGSAGKACVTHGVKDQVYVSKIVACGYPVSTVCVHNTTGVITTYFSGTKNNSGRMTRELQDLKIYNDKQIPPQYLYGSIEQRLELLAGLMDTDGSVDKNSRCRFINTNRKLIDGVIALVRSFGWRVTETEAQPSLTASGIQGKKVCWAIGFQPTIKIPMALERKQIKRFPKERRIGLKSVTLDPQGKVGHCIQVDASDGLYLVGAKLTPTHNSVLSSILMPAWFMGKFPDKKIIMASHTADLSVDFGRKVRDMIADPAYQKIFPEVELKADAKAAGRWSTNKGGEYYAVGVGGALAGRGADLFIIDDPHAFALDTLVPTTKGFKTIAEIAIGDKVYGPDGKATKVIGKSDVWYDRPIYEVTTDDGANIECDGGHLWNYRSHTSLTAPYKNATTRELVKWSSKSKPCLPRHSPVQYPHKKLSVDPYVLGAWLGDGTTGLNRMTSHPNDMPFMRKQFEQVGYVTTTHTDPYSFGIKGLRADLRDIGVLDSKHIPEQYLTASIAQRMALLQGLMDTDGDVTELGQCSFNNCNEQMVRQFRELVHSLGVKAKIHQYDDARLNHNSVYRVTFKLKDACRMERKNIRTVTPTDKRCRSIEVKETTRCGAVQCITVERTDGLFLVGREYVVTHNSEQQAMSGNPEVFTSAWDWFQSGPLQRLMPGGAIIVLMTRWSNLDLSGQIINHMTKNPEADQWEVVELPAILPSGSSLWPEFWPIEQLLAKKAGMDPRYWEAQYMQTPTSDGAALLKREWWQYWDKEDPPEVKYIIMSLDAAQESHNRADYNAVTTWGVFDREDKDGSMISHVILLDAWKKRMEYPELKKKMFEYYEEWKPDTLIIEKKSNGAALCQEMRRAGVPLHEYTPGKGQDKISRVNSISDMFSSGMVWAAKDRRWAQEVISECAEFPLSSHDDFVDSVTLAMIRIRQGGLLRLPTDAWDPDDQVKRTRHGGYY